MIKTLALLFVFIYSPHQTDALQWKQIKEMSGPIPGYPNLTIRTYASEIARGGDKVKVAMKFDFPDGTPYAMFQKNVPRGVDPSTISRAEGRIQLDCKKLEVKPEKASAMFYLTNGTQFKSKEPPFKIAAGNLLAKYFCEGESPKSTKPPILKSPSQYSSLSRASSATFNLSLGFLPKKLLGGHVGW